MAFKFNPFSGTFDVVSSLADLGITATATELNYVDGVTSAIQTQLAGKAGVMTVQSLGSKSANFVFNPNSGLCGKVTVTAGVNVNITDWASATEAVFAELHVTANAVYTLTFYSGGTGTTVPLSSGLLMSTWATSGATNKVDVVPLYWDGVIWHVRPPYPDMRNA